MRALRLSTYCLWALLLSPIVSADKAGVPEPKPALLGVVPAPAPRGVLIHQVLADSAAQKAGLKAGDIILSVNGNKMNSPQTLILEIRKYAAEAPVTLEYERGGVKQTVKIALGVRQDPASLIGKRAPEFSLPAFPQNVKISLKPGKIYIVDFWATWCGPCEPVRQALEDFQRGDKSGRIEIMGITTEDAATLYAFYRGKKPPYTILIDASNEVTTNYRVQGYPTIAVIDAKGVVRFAGFASGGGFETAIELAQRLAREP